MRVWESLTSSDEGQRVSSERGKKRRGREGKGVYVYVRLGGWISERMDSRMMEMGRREWEEGS